MFVAGHLGIAAYSIPKPVIELFATLLAELAERLGHPTGTIKSWLHRGLARLKACLDG